MHWIKFHAILTMIRNESVQQNPIMKVICNKHVDVNPIHYYKLYVIDAVMKIQCIVLKVLVQVRDWKMRQYIAENKLKTLNNEIKLWLGTYPVHVAQIRDTSLALLQKAMTTPCICFDGVVIAAQCTATF